VQEIEITFPPKCDPWFFGQRIIVIAVMFHAYMPIDEEW
jgi:hypothetical protein